jgi:hypothetical protein
MEDYQAAFLQRHQDQIILDKNNRRIASMHLGGIVIECLLKRMIMASLPRNASQEWKTDSNNPGHTIKNPKHSLINAVRCHSRLYTAVQNFPVVLDWLNIVERPYSKHFIDLRYDGNEIKQEDYQKWFQAYNHLKGWLQQQAIKP